MTAEQRFWRLVRKTETCWLYGRAGIVQPGAYSTFWDGERQIHAHQYSARLAGLVVPPGMDVCHSCEAKNCVRPSHLYVATHGQNIRDMAAARFARGLCRTTSAYPTSTMLRWCAGFPPSEAT